MGKIEIDVPERHEMKISQLIEQGEYIDRQEAVEDLVSIGIKTLKTSGKQDQDEFDDYEDTMGGDDEYLF
ncbi:MAG: cell surface protein [Halobacteria archaeon]